MEHMGYGYNHCEIILVLVTIGDHKKLFFIVSISLKCPDVWIFPEIILPPSVPEY